MASISKDGEKVTGKKSKLKWPEPPPEIKAEHDAISAYRQPQEDDRLPAFRQLKTSKKLEAIYADLCLNVGEATWQDIDQFLVQFREKNFSERLAEIYELVLVVQSD